MAVAAFASGCGSSASTSASGGGSSGTPFTTVFVGPLSGPIGAYGQQELTGVKAAVAVLNKSGGILGHKVILKELDDQGTTATGLTLLSQAVTGSTPPGLVVAGITPFEALAFAPYLSQKRILGMTAAPAPPITSSVASHETFFSLSLPYQQEWQTLGNVTAKHGWKTVYILYNDDASGLANIKIIQAEAAKIGVKVLGSASFADTALDVTPAFQKALAAHPDAIWETDDGQSATVFKSRLTAGATNIPILCDGGCAGDTAIKSLDGAQSLANAYTFSWPLNATPPAKRTTREKQYITATSAVGGPINWSVTGDGYDEVMVAAAGARQANSIAADKIAAALQNLKPAENTWSMGYPYEFSATDHGAEAASAPSPLVPVPLNNNLPNGAHK